MLFLVGLVVILVAAGAYASMRRAEQKPWLGWAGIGVAVAVLWTVGLSISPISIGHVGVAKWFGAVQPTAFPEGMRFMNPMYEITQMSIQRGSVDFSKAKDADGPTVVAVSKDRNPVRVEASFPYALNPKSAWKVLQRIGNRDTFERQVVVPAARAAIRDVVADFPWVEASVTSRLDVERRLGEATNNAVIADLMGLGFTDAEARNAITFMPVMLREILPDEKVLNSIAERVASEEDLKRQAVLTEIAKAIAERRANEGLGVERLFANLPKGFSPSQIKEVLSALADKERADALTKAVENGKVSVMVLPSSTPLAVTPPQQ